jgi:putative peptidoglycan lipid II flippase
MSGTGRHIFRASLVVMAAHVIFKIAGLAQMRVLGHYCDDVTLDIFLFSFNSVLWSLFLIGEESLGPAFLPLFKGELDTRGEDAAWRFAGTVLSLQLVLLGVAITVVMLFPEQVLSYLTEWEDKAQNPRYLEEGPSYVRWMAPALLFLSTGSLTYLLLNSYKRFFFAALGDAMVKFGIIAAVLVGAALSEEWMLWLVVGVLVGAAGKIGLHLVGGRREIPRIRFNLDVRSDAFRKLMILIAPLLIGIVFAKVRDVFNDAWALSEVGEEGLVAANRFGRAIFNSVGWLVPYSVSIAMFPFLCELVDRDDRPELARLVTAGMHIIWVLVMPVAAIVVALSFPLSRLLFETGRFDLEACSLAATANAAYTLVLPFFALEYVLMQTYFSNRRMVAPIVMGLVFSSVAMGISYLGIVHYGATGAAALMVVAGGYTVSRTGKVIALAVFLKRYIPELPLRHAAWFVFRMLVAGALAGCTAYGVRLLLEGLTGPPVGSSQVAEVMKQVLPVLVLGTVAGCLVYLGALRLLCPAEWAQTVHWTRRRLSDWSRRKGGGAEGSSSSGS